MDVTLLVLVGRDEVRVWEDLQEDLRDDFGEDEQEDEEEDDREEEQEDLLLGDLARVWDSGELIVDLYVH